MKLSRICRSLPQGIVSITAVAFLCFAAGCATPIGVNHVDRSVAYHSLAANAISAQRASSFSARELINQGVTIFVEVGPGNVLGGLLKRIDRSVRTFSVNDLKSLDEVTEALG